MRITKAILKDLNEALICSQDLIRTDTNTCSIKKEIKQEIKGYVEIWIIPYLKRAINSGINGKGKYRSLAR